MQQRLLVVVDIQREYQSPGRAYEIKTIGPSLATAKRVLDHARAHKIPVFHVKHHNQSGEIFQKGTEYSDYIPGFEPLPVESEFTKFDYSCFSSPEFERRMRSHQKDEILVIGYGSTKCCISTIIDGYHRGYKFVFLKDASNAKASGEFSEADLHARASEIITSFAKVATADEVLK